MTFSDKQLLCPVCQTGKDTYENDKKSPMCPYIYLHSTVGCPFFVELAKTDNNATHYLDE